MVHVLVVFWGDMQVVVQINVGTICSSVVYGRGTLVDGGSRSGADGGGYAGGEV